ncbi:uncharacterized protein MONOS_10883 [Monocercomonoides exilis]|uniref:uncharacterized protein n=1 Tax=Monocercomonoides exilis TaxID=2049356 RepID=UPI00355A9005|nr:hypothetical protein MONOS_10883 [Monocercomonoides exilis]|eukprot:MONOS_10883.1-p1 / transcript=MONOS_10883.1 / gene=MONOS_10883 / organism=Monocercomonoides_exilis_PA203 / gene_product=unspecified product / transcript_product=unspecified product / location=Mono_scaffold00515:4324-5328(+) / protein_length=335 / sequence_SO=supercontig / SO=protein_coding / is_pseudo=false
MCQDQWMRVPEMQSKWLWRRTSLQTFNVSGSSCIGTENGNGESACVFECFFTSCSLTSKYGGGMYCYGVPAAFIMRSLQFISCSAVSYGGGLDLFPDKTSAPVNDYYCFFLFFHGCRCSRDQPHGHDVYYEDRYSLYLFSNSPFYECYTTNTDDQRVCYGYNYTGRSWLFQHTEKKDWLKDKTLYVSVNGNDNLEQCGANESNPCLTEKKAFEMCEVQISLAITLMDGNHTSETVTVEIGEKKISAIGKGREESSIGMKSVSSAAGALFSILTGHLGMSHLKVDCNSKANPSTPSVVVVSDGSGSLSLEDVVISTRKTESFVRWDKIFDNRRFH